MDWTIEPASPRLPFRVRARVCSLVRLHVFERPLDDEVFNDHNCRHALGHAPSDLTAGFGRISRLDGNAVALAMVITWRGRCTRPIARPRGCNHRNLAHFPKPARPLSGVFPSGDPVLGIPAYCSRSSSRYDMPCRLEEPVFPPSEVTQVFTATIGGTTNTALMWFGKPGTGHFLIICGHIDTLATISLELLAHWVYPFGLVGRMGTGGCRPAERRKGVRNV